MEVGQKYRIVYKTDYQRKERVSVLRYLGEENTSWVFDGRPEFGTQEFPKKWVQSITPVDNSTPIAVNVKA